MCCSSMECLGGELAGAADAQFAREARLVVVALFPVPLAGLRRAAAGGALRPAVYVGGTVAEGANATVCCAVDSAGASSCCGRRRCGPLVGVGFRGLRVRRGAVPERQRGGALDGDDRRRRDGRVARMGAAVLGGGLGLLQRQCSLVGVYIHLRAGVGERPEPARWGRVSELTTH